MTKLLLAEFTWRITVCRWYKAQYPLDAHQYEESIWRLDAARRYLMRRALRAA
jgi:hypothetical protein